MNKSLITISILISSLSYAKVEVLDRIAIIVDDGVVMESQIKSTIDEVIDRYEDQNLENHLKIFWKSRLKKS